mgnify:CR=1 FL=1
MKPVHIFAPEFEKGFTENKKQPMSNLSKNIHIQDASDQNGCSPFNGHDSQWPWAKHKARQCVKETETAKRKSKEPELQRCTHGSDSFPVGILITQRVAELKNDLPSKSRCLNGLGLDCIPVPKWIIVIILFFFRFTLTVKDLACVLR